VLFLFLFTMPLWHQQYVFIDFAADRVGRMSAFLEM